MRKEELATRYAGDENQPEYLAFIEGWNAVIRELKLFRETRPKYTGYSDNLVEQLENGTLNESRK